MRAPELVERQDVVVLQQPLDRLLALQHPLLLYRVWVEADLQQLVEVLDPDVLLQVAPLAEQLVVLEAEVSVACALALGDRDRRPVEQPHRCVLAAAVAVEQLV
ncbi:hypothetical protein [Mumia zhuanghuii]|uniref:Uncharacterized protein n=1 Tax=Mumia zhuanghuii TaxID=2585211 RepID=A0A5C4MDN8_9ACTN|nr:hypothetical protein [Mumia zhuanghuii]TNC33522.1 hypothetical protein FHE65_28955 [Mumia zhuanghuii]